MNGRVFATAGLHLAAVALLAVAADAEVHFGFEGGDHYVRNMKTYGVLPSSLDPATSVVDPYGTDRAYWRSFWHRPTRRD
jgi:hypothetical protein